MNSGEINYSQSSDSIAHCVRHNLQWHRLSFDIKAILRNDETNYDKFILNYSLKNQIRYRGSLVAKVFHREERYYELLIQKSIRNLSLFPYHLADMVTKGLRVTPFNYYLEILSLLLANDKSYDTLPNFTAVDCVRVLGIGRNEYLSLVSELKTNTVRHLFYTTKPNPMKFLPNFPVRVRIEPWWSVEVGLIIEDDIKYLTRNERRLIDNLIDYGSHVAGKCDYNVLHNLYRRGLIYVDVPISGEDRISIPPLKNFVMNRVSGDYFENLLYKIFVSVDEHMTIAELAQMLQLDLLLVKQAVSLFCRLGFAKLKESALCHSLSQIIYYHPTWSQYQNDFVNVKQQPQITPLNYNKYNNMDVDVNTKLVNNNNNQQQSRPVKYIRTISIENDNNKGHNIDCRSIDDVIGQNYDKDKDNSIEYLSSSDGNMSDFSFANVSTPSPQANLNSALLKTNVITNDVNTGIHSNRNLNNRNITSSSSNQSCESDIYSEAEDINEGMSLMMINNDNSSVPLSMKSGQRIAFLFDSTLTAFLMMGNLSPDLKNHAVTMFEVGKLCEESLDTFLNELEKVSLLDADSEGDVSRYFTHAIILRSTICSLRHLLPAGLDLLRVECLERLDQKTQNRVLEKKYKMIISATPLNATLTHFPAVPFIGQFYCSSDTSHMWTKLFYNHISGYGPPSLFLCRGTVLKALPSIFLGYGKLLVNILNSDSYVLNSENYNNINDQLRNGCVLVQAYGIRTSGELHYEAFPFDDYENSKTLNTWCKHNAVVRLKKHLDLSNHCGYITFLKTGVCDIGCEYYDSDVHITVPRKKSLTTLIKNRLQQQQQQHQLNNNNNENDNTINRHKKSFNTLTTSIIENGNVAQLANDEDYLRKPDENYFGEINIEKLDNADDDKQQQPSAIFAGADSSVLLADELAQCDNKGTIKSQTSIEIPMYGNDRNNSQMVYDISNGTENTIPSTSTAEVWTLLDVNFGVPLFDIDCNTKICEKIAKKLCKDKCLEIAMSERRKMSDIFNKFIRQCLMADEMALCKLANGPPHPCYNLAFENGRVCYWNGK